MDALRLPVRIHQALLEEARRHQPNECCGLLGGQGSRVEELFPASNRLASPSAYEISPEELFELFRRLRAGQLQLVGIYHSHPSGENQPSARDRERAYYPEAAYVIISPRPDAAQPVRAFRIEGESVREQPVEVVV